MLANLIVQTLISRISMIAYTLMKEINKQGGHAKRFTFYVTNTTNRVLFGNSTTKLAQSTQGWADVWDSIGQGNGLLISTPFADASAVH